MAPIKRLHPPQETSSQSQIITHHLRGGLSAHQRVHKISVPYNTDGPLLLFLVSNVTAGSGMFWGSEIPKADKKSNGGFCSAFAYFVGSSEELRLFSKFLSARCTTSVHHPRVRWPAQLRRASDSLCCWEQHSLCSLIETGGLNNVHCY